MCQVEQWAGEGQECARAGVVSAFFSMKLAVSAYGVSGGSYFFRCCFCVCWGVACRGRVSPRRASNFLVATRKLPKKRVCRQLSGGTHYAPAALRSNSRRKSDFYCEGRDAYARRWCCAICEELIFLTTATVSLLLSLRVYTDLRNKNMHPACCLNLVTPLLPVPRRTEHRVGRCAAGRICIVIKLAAAV